MGSRRRLDATVLFYSALATKAGLHPTDYKALGVLDRLGPMSAGELGRHIGLAVILDFLDHTAEQSRTRTEAIAGSGIGESHPDLGGPW